MHILKSAWLDILVSILVMVFVVTKMPYLDSILWIYSLFLLFGKILSLFSKFLSAKSTSSVPNLVYHALYLTNILLFFSFKFFGLGGVWVVIWALSTIQTYSSGKTS